MTNTVSNELREYLKYSETILSFYIKFKAYFNPILRLAKVSELFPVNLDEVCMLVYNRKDNASRGLKKGFIENEYYVTVHKNVKEENLQRLIANARLYIIKRYPKVCQ